MKHYRTTYKKYKGHAKTDAVRSIECAFCDPSAIEEIIKETDTVRVVRNRVKYDMFDGDRVVDHLMVIPKAHRASVGEFTDQELLDSFRIAGEYEEQGYGIYARGKGAATRSIEHQHTHLMKLANRPARLILYSHRPYFLFDR